MRRTMMLCAALGMTALFTTGAFVQPAHAESDFRVIKWSITGVCQIYDFGWGGKPIPWDYHVMTRPLPDFAVALRAKDSLARRGMCTL